MYYSIKHIKKNFFLKRNKVFIIYHVLINNNIVLN